MTYSIRRMCPTCGKRFTTVSDMPRQKNCFDCTLLTGSTEPDPSSQSSTGSQATALSTSSRGKRKANGKYALSSTEPSTTVRVAEYDIEQERGNEV